MVLYSYLQRHRHLRTELRRVLRGFSLLEIVLVLFVLGLMATLLTPSVQDVVVRAQREAEVRNLDQLADSITASFQSTDLTNLNVAALPGTIGSADTPTIFSGATNTAYATTANTDWFAKVARHRGVTPQLGVAPTAALQPELARITANGTGNPRYLFAAPGELGRQRFLLVSVVAPAGQLVLPPYEANAAWFDALWNNNWESRTAGLPAYWSGRISAGQAAAWTSGSGGLTQAYRLCVKRISLPKFTFTVNNNHATDTAWLSFNNTAPAFTAGPNTGAGTTGEILGGRLIILNRGTSWPGVEALRFRLTANDAVTLQ